ncbi:MAG: NAD-dependent epimerase/dehydratase family protein [Candidatus Nomurabacteria bacterium]|jgi:GDP-4-dehydro-6-deoxy-D-mannose reductase|nr:NAD-dependent epimerase/dehydratase family protein [Candidatus Nomurabacteria bacterium]
MNLRVAVTGVSGFVGHHLARELKSHGAYIIGADRNQAALDRMGDLVDEHAVADLAEQWPVTSHVDAVINLAGMAAVGPSFDKPQAYINTNSSILTNICEYYLSQENRPRILTISSGAVYDSDQSMPIGESGKLSYGSPYAVSKILNESQCKYYRTRGLDCIVARPFNHIGPGQLPGFLVPDLLAQLLEAKESGRKTIPVGNLKSKRDYTDVRDVVKAYYLLISAESLAHGTYNICSGKSVSGEEVLEIMQHELGTDIKTAVDESRIRPNDPPVITGDAAALQVDTGWQLSIPIKQTLKDFIGDIK